MPLRFSDGTHEDWIAFKEEIKEVAPRLGIDKIGFATADPFLALKDILMKHRAKGHESGFEEPDIEKRVDPARSLVHPQSIISIAIAYPSKLPDPPRSQPGAYRGIISRSAWGEDYHHVLRKRLERLASYMSDQVEGFRVKLMVDTGALVDRAVAQRAGVGWLGKNCSVITPEWGSWVYLGEMITNIPFPADSPIQDQCGECTLCIDACPTGALVGPGQLNAQRCISFVTQTKGIVSDEMKEKIGNRLYGCDTCQVVCPKNKTFNWTHQAEFQPDPELVKPLLTPLLSMSNKQFKEKYGHSAASWRGKTPIQRNAMIAIGHFKDETAVSELITALHSDPREVIRATAAWALGRIATQQALHAIDDALLRESHEAVMTHLQQAKSVIENSVKR